MSIEAGIPAAREVYERLVRSRVVLDDWTMRTRRTSPDSTVLSTGWSLIESFDEFLALPLTSLKTEMEVTIREEEVPEVLEEAQGAEDARLTVLLDTVRDFRRHLSSVSFERLLTASRRRDPALAKELTSRRTSALARAGEWERLFVFLGAGGDADAHLAADLIPAAREDLSPTPSVPFDL